MSDQRIGRIARGEHERGVARRPLPQAGLREGPRKMVVINDPKRQRLTVCDRIGMRDHGQVIITPEFRERASINLQRCR